VEEWREENEGVGCRLLDPSQWLVFCAGHPLAMPSDSYSSKHLFIQIKMVIFAVVPIKPVVSGRQGMCLVYLLILSAKHSRMSKEGMKSQNSFGNFAQGVPVLTT
jgi:hypothetical protein